MFYEFYIDQFTAEHLLSGYLLLLSASSAVRRKVSCKRLLAGSTASVMTMLFLICSGIPGWYFLGMFTAGLVAFGEKNLKQTGRSLWALLIITCCFGGVLETVVHILGLPSSAAIIISGLLLYQIAERKKKKGYAEVLCHVRLEWQGRTCTVQALLDTGNSLREPLTGQPVSILACKEAGQLLEHGWERRKGCYLIPYHSLGTDRGWMQAVTADRMQVEYAGEKITVETPVIALYQGKLGKNCQMILHCEHVRVQEYS